MERLRMQIIEEIIFRLRRGQSQRAISRDTGCARNTVSQYAQWASRLGYLAPDSDMPSMEAFRDTLPQRKRRSNVSSAEPYREIIETYLQTHIEAVTIHNNLKRLYGFTGSYSSVIRFINGLTPKEQLAIIRLETDPGKQAQVDFGFVGQMKDPATGKMRSTYAFLMTLSHSRHQYVEFVFNQRIPTWVNCHINAFEFFGGVPEELVIDNLKSAVLKADIYDPVISEPYRQLALHYDFLIHPCRVRTPEHKGKVENGVHYVQRNFIAGREFMDIDEANLLVKTWITQEAGLRNHGTTHKQPLAQFNQVEKSTLKSLPDTEFDLIEVRSAKVHRDCHVTVYGSYYSVPYSYIGSQMDVHLHERVVQIYDNDHKLVGTHQRATQQGQRITRMTDYPTHKVAYMVLSIENCLELGHDIGPSCVTVLNALLADRPVDRRQSVKRIVRLVQTYSSSRLEAACARSLYYQDGSYQRIAKILRAGTDHEPMGITSSLPPKKDYLFARSADEFILVSNADTNMEVEAC